MIPERNQRGRLLLTLINFEQGPTVDPIFPRVTFVESRMRMELGGHVQRFVRFSDVNSNSDQQIPEV